MLTQAAGLSLFAITLASCTVDSDAVDVEDLASRRKPHPIADAGVSADASQVPAADGAAPGPAAVPVHAVLVANDDGTHRVNITAAQIASWLDYANSVYAAANMHFTFDQVAGVSSTNSTLINQMLGSGDPQWSQEKTAANTLAASYPKQLVILFRFGPGSSPTGSAFSWSDLNFVAAPGFNDTGVCGHQNISLLAHEIGHYFGLAHTFGNYRYATVADAAAALSAAGNNLAVFDGDATADTPPDPNVDAIQCTTSTQVTMNGITFAIPRDNTMSYLDAPTKTFSAQQITRVHQLLASRFGL